MKCTPDGHHNTHRVVKVVNKQEVERMDVKYFLNSIKYPSKFPQYDAIDAAYGWVIPYGQDLFRRVLVSGFPEICMQIQRTRYLIKAMSVLARGER